MEVRSKIYTSETVVNKKPRKGQNDEYVACYIQLDNGDVVPALFTHVDLEKAIRRAGYNTEDVPPRFVSVPTKIANKWRSFFGR